MKPRNRSKWKSTLSSPFSLVIALILLLLLVKAAWSIHEKSNLSAERLDKANAELAKLQSDQVALAKRTDDLSTDTGIEAEMREKYRAVRPGESVAVIVDSSKALNQLNDVASSTTPAKKGFWRSLLKLFGFM